MQQSSLYEFTWLKFCYEMNKKIQIACARNFQSKSGLGFFARLNFLIKVQAWDGWVPKAAKSLKNIWEKGKERCVTALILAKVDFFLPNFVGRKVSHLVKAATSTKSRAADHCVNFWQTL